MDNASEFFTVGQKNITFNDSAQTDGTAFMKNFAGGQEIPLAVVGNYGAEVEDFEEAEVNGKIASRPARRRNYLYEKAGKRTGGRRGGWSSCTIAWMAQRP
ncbi:MAG: hypothetical protein ACLR23_20810 [Clostridia bacterium]